MKNISPYITLDIQLEHLLMDVTFPQLATAGYYCVFWWRNIPLGELFIEKNQLLSTASLPEKVLMVIEPAIDYYIGASTDLAAGYKKAFLDKSKDAFSHEMDRLLAPFLPASFPAIVDMSVVICTRNRSASLKICLERLKAQQCAPAEIIVVDNAPSDDNTRLVAAQFPDVIYYREPIPGLDIARNAGARLAKSTIVAYVDDDVFVHPLWSYRTWESFSSPEVSATTGLVIAASLDTEAQQIFEKFWTFNRGYTDKIYDDQFFNKFIADGPPVWEIGAGANMAFRKSSFEKYGYFDKRLDVGAAGCSGDSELWFRILAEGGTIRYSPRSVVYHEHRKDLKQLHRQLFSYMRGFAAAALIQQEYYTKAQYKKRVFNEVPLNYLNTLIRAFPRYSFQNRTVFSEIKGLISGIIFYHKNKNKPAQ